MLTPLFARRTPITTETSAEISIRLPEAEGSVAMVEQAWAVDRRIVMSYVLAHRIPLVPIRRSMALETLLGSEALRRLILHFLVHPEQRLHFRALQRHLDLSRQSLRNALDHLSALGLVREHREERRVVYERTDHPGWHGLIELVRTLEDPAEVLRHLLRSVPSVQAAFVFGSAARRSMRHDSDVDVLILEDESADQAQVGEAILGAALLLGREIDAKYYTPEQLQTALTQPGTNYIKRVVEGPKRWVVGSAEVVGIG